MAVYDIVLDPDGDIFVIVPGTIPEGHLKHQKFYRPKPIGAEPPEIEVAALEPLPEEPPAEPETAAPEPAPTESPAEPPAELVAAESVAAESVAAEPVAAESVAAEPVAAAPEPAPEEPQFSIALPPEEDKWRFKVSSKHLALASIYVKKMVSGPWRGTNGVHDDELPYWVFEGFDVHAISIILSIIHGLNRRVPRVVDLSMLAQIARVVDFLECHETIELYASIWVDHLASLTPSSSREDWDSWISITGVFQNPAIFRDWTRVAILEKLNCPPSLELPILAHAYELIDQRRQIHLDRILNCVYAHVERLSEQKTCCVECDAILLGTLIRQLRANSLPSLCPTRPYEGLSVRSVVKMIKGLSVPAWYAKVIESEEPAINPFDFWGATKKTKKYSKKAKLKTKRTASPNNGWAGYDVPAEEEDMTEVVVVEHNCGFGELITLVNNLESEIKGLDLGNDLGIRRLE